jgi:glycosyltransferase involved in cell wall biosynthesis
MKILVLPSWDVPTGGYFVKYQSEALKRIGHEVRIISLEYRSLKKFNLKLFLNYNHITSCKENELWVYRGIYWKLPKFERLNTFLFTKKIYKTFVKVVIKEYKPDVIHVHAAMWAGYTAFLIHKKYNIPYVITEHRARFVANSKFAASQFKSWYSPILTSVYSNASCIIPVSKLLIPKINEFLNKPVKIEVIPNLIDTDFFIPANKNLVPDNVFRFVMIGFLRKVKGLDILLKAFAKLRKALPNVHLTIVGEGEEKNNLFKLMDKLNLKDSICFTGKLSREGVRETLQKASAFVLSSRAEACAQVVLEALSCGLPVVSTDIMADDVITPENGVFVKNDDVDSLYQGMRKIIENYDYFDRKKIRDFAVNNFSYDKIISRVEKELLQAIK